MRKMIIRGVSNIRSVHSINTRPGPISESTGLLKLYLLAAEKANLSKRLEWVKRQKDQVERRLLEIAHSMNLIKKVVEEKTNNQQVSDHGFKFRKIPLKY